MLMRCLLLAGLLVPTTAAVSSAQTSSVPMKVRHIHIYVKDVESTKAFYRDKFGMKVSDERPGQMVEFEGGQLWFGKWNGSGELHTDAIVIGIEPKSVEATYNMLKQRGVDIPNPPKEQRYGWSFRVKDPSGYMIEVEGPK